eukprot:Clim_evm64s119 gene=Clim_evmTU64s119
MASTEPGRPARKPVASHSPTAAHPNFRTAQDKDPPFLIVQGMAGAGKTTLMQRLASFVSQKKKRPYCMNLDPAVLEVPFPASIDIRDSVKYKEVMKQYGLGPNGAIVTSLNLFATRFDQVVSILEQRIGEVDYMLCDTPGQIEVMTWSASGQILMESVASMMPTVQLFIVDTPRCTSPITFMSNMLYACSIMYKNRLPMVIVFNKIDVADSRPAREWMDDFLAFEEALAAEHSYSGDLARSMALSLDEFYHLIPSVGVSAMTGQGFDELLDRIEEARKNYFEDYVPFLDEMRSKPRPVLESGIAPGELSEVDDEEGKDSEDEIEADEQENNENTQWSTFARPVRGP